MISYSVNPSKPFFRSDRGVADGAPQHQSRLWRFAIPVYVVRWAPSGSEHGGRAGRGTQRAYERGGWISGNKGSGQPSTSKRTET